MYRELMASRHLCFENQWPQANYALQVYGLTQFYAIENRWAHEFMHWKIDRLKQISIGKYLDSWKFCP